VGNKRHPGRDIHIGEEKLYINIRSQTKSSTKKFTSLKGDLNVREEMKRGGQAVIVPRQNGTEGGKAMGQ